MTRRVAGGETVKRHRLCECFREEGDSRCVIHGIERSDGEIVLECAKRGCSASTTAEDVDAGWLLTDGGWLCSECRPL